MSSWVPFSSPLLPPPPIVFAATDAFGDAGRSMKSYRAVRNLFVYKKKEKSNSFLHSDGTNYHFTRFRFSVPCVCVVLVDGKRRSCARDAHANRGQGFRFS